MKVGLLPFKKVSFITHNESPLKRKNAPYLIVKVLFIHRIFKFLSWLFGRVGKRLDKKAKVKVKFYDVTTWLTNNYNTDIAQISRSKNNQTIKFNQLIKRKKNFSSKITQKIGSGRLVADPFLLFEKASYEVKAGGVHLSFNIFR